MLLTTFATLTWIGWCWWGLLCLSGIGLVLAVTFEITVGLKTAGGFGWAMFVWMMGSCGGAMLLLLIMLAGKVRHWLS